MSGYERAWISKLVKGRGDVLEIGTFCGLTTATLLRSAAGLVFSVDPLDRAPPRDPDAVRWIQQLAAEFPKRLIFFPAFSTELIWRRPIDILFIDGDHSDRAVYDDLERFVPYLLEDGLLILDDWTTVEPAFHRYCKTYPGALNSLDGHGKLAAFTNGRQTGYPQ